MCLDADDLSRAIKSQQPHVSGQDRKVAALSATGY